MDIVFIRGLKVETVIGIYDWERSIKQTLILDLEMATDIRPAATSDDISHALNYKSVAKRVSAFIEQSRFQLVEALAEQCALLILHEFNTPWLRLCINKKGAVSSAEDVGVIIERGRKPG